MLYEKKYKFYTNEENRIISDIISASKYENEFINKNIDDYLLQCKKVENHLIYEMITSNIIVNDEVIKELWDIFFRLI